MAEIEMTEKAYEAELTRRFRTGEACGWEAVSKWLVALAAEHFAAGKDSDAILVRGLGQEAAKRGAVLRKEAGRG